MSLRSGDTVGSYEIIGALGAGGMGEVYRARDSKLKRDVAIKVLPKTFTSDPARLARFQREAEVLASLDHPNIGTIYGLVETGGAQALVLALIEGPTLAERIAAGPLPLAEATEIARQIIAALEYAHERGVIHRDLKPANVKITPEGTVKVLDFGLAKVLDEEHASSPQQDSPTLTLGHTRAGIILGTAAYMSPEQAVGKPADRRSDIFSFGVVLYEMLTGKRAFTGDSGPEILASVVKDEPDWSKLPAATPSTLRSILQRCLVKERKQRMQAIGEARIALENPNNESPAAPVPSVGSLWPALATALAVIALVLGFGWWRASQPGEQPLVRLDLDLGADVSLPNVPIGPVILSPDGTRLAYLSDERKLFVRKLDQDKAVELAAAQTATLPFFSPDGKWIGYFDGGADPLYKISVEGGPAVKLADVPGHSGGSWGDDGGIVVAHNRHLVRVPEGGGTPTPITEDEDGAAVPQVLPGGKAVLYTSLRRRNSFGAGSSIKVVTLGDRKVKTLIPEGASARYVPSLGDSKGHLVYTSQGTLFAVPFDLDKLETRGNAVALRDDLAYFAATGTPQYDVSLAGHGALAYRRGGAMGATGGASATRIIQWWYPTGKKEPLFATPSNYVQTRVSPDGKRLAVIAGENTINGDLWVYDLERDNRTQLTRGGTHGSPVWTPNGKYLLLESRDGILWMRADGSGQPQTLIASKNLPAPWSITRDGKLLAYMESPQGPIASQLAQIWTAPLTEESGQLKAGKPEMFPGTGFQEPAFSPDGKWLAYVAVESARRDGRRFQVSREVYVRPFPPTATGGGGQVHISNNGGTNPVWARNELLYQERDGSIMAISFTIQGGEFKAGKPRVWAHSGSRSLYFDLDPNGNRVAIIAPVETSAAAPEEAPKPEHTVVFLLNFFDELRRRAPSRR